MADVEISGPARRDLREIHRWIAQDDPVAADRVLSDLRDAVTRLAEMPGLGHVRDDLADQFREGESADGGAKGLSAAPWRK